MNILRNEKYVLVKEMGDMKTIGKAYEVANITDTAIVMRDAVSKIAACAVDFSTFNEYFERVENVRGWTPWQSLLGTRGEVAFYRTNYKKVQVKINDKWRGEATCNKDDDFNLYFGVRLAYLRAKNKMMEQYKTDYENYLNGVNADILANKNIMKQMINSLDKETD